MKRPYIIAEIGVNFYDTAKILGISALDAAKLYIDKVKESGCDCAKFQAYKAEKIASVNSPAYWDLTKENTKSQYELFKKFDSFGEEEYRELSRYSHEIGLDFTATPFDYEAADFLFDLVDFYKISSSDITNLPFIRHIAKKKKPVYISAGASYLSEVDEAVRVIEEEGVKDIVIMHCVLSYPTKPEDANLSVIETLKRVYPEYRIGYSDHIPPDDEMLTLSTAYMLGAEVLEKHFTLDKTLSGNDHYHAGDVQNFTQAVSNFKRIALLMGEPEKKVLKCEEISRLEARRSLVLVRDMYCGDVISAADLAAKRPGTGISPKYTDFVTGLRLNADQPADTILQWNML